MVKLQIKKVRKDAIMPTQAHSGDMYDLYAAEDITIDSRGVTIVPLGIAMDIPEGYRIKVFARSSLSLKKKIIVSNGVGIIDTGYKNELGLLCHTLPSYDMVELLRKNDSFGGSTILNGAVLLNSPVEIHKGDKIAQFQLEKIEEFEMEEVEELDMSNDRGGGYGSTEN